MEQEQFSFAHDDFTLEDSLLFATRYNPDAVYTKPDLETAERCLTQTSIKFKNLSAIKQLMACGVYAIQREIEVIGPEKSVVDVEGLKQPVFGGWIDDFQKTYYLESVVAQAENIGEIRFKTDNAKAGDHGIKIIDSEILESVLNTLKRLNETEGFREIRKRKFYQTYKAAMVAGEGSVAAVAVEYVGQKHVNRYADLRKSLAYYLIQFLNNNADPGLPSVLNKNVLSIVARYFKEVKLLNENAQGDPAESIKSWYRRKKQEISPQ